MVETTRIAAKDDAHDKTGLRWLAAGGFLAAIGASSCCIIPLLLFSLGISGAWIGTLTALSPLKPIFIAVALGLVGWGLWMNRRARNACHEDGVCTRPMPSRVIPIALWAALALILIAAAWDWIAPVLAPLLLGL
ncbi:MAG: mercuric transporter MerT family protein [Brevirhabdus sp.]